MDQPTAQAIPLQAPEGKDSGSTFLWVLIVVISATCMVIGLVQMISAHNKDSQVRTQEIQALRQSRSAITTPRAPAVLPITQEAPSRVRYHRATPTSTEPTAAAAGEEISPPAPALVTPDPNAAPLQVEAISGDLKVVVRNCVHQLDKTVRCEAWFVTSADHPKELALKEGGTAKDDQGNSTDIPLNWINSDLGWNVHLRTPAPVKFNIRFKDHTFGTSKKVLITFHLRWDGTYGDIDIPEMVRIS